MDPYTTSTEPILQPTFVGHVANREDALLIIEACLSGALHHIFRFPRQRKLQDLIRSGNIFLYAEIATIPETGMMAKIGYFSVVTMDFLSNVNALAATVASRSQEALLHKECLTLLSPITK